MFDFVLSLLMRWPVLTAEVCVTEKSQIISEMIEISLCVLHVQRNSCSPICISDDGCRHILLQNATVPHQSPEDISNQTIKCLFNNTYVMRTVSLDRILDDKMIMINVLSTDLIRTKPRSCRRTN